MADDKTPYHERYKAAPPPDYMRYLTAPFEGYWKRQGNLAREGLAMAEDGAQRARGGDMSGYLGAVLGPLNYLTSPINALLPEEQATRDFGRSVGGSTGEALAASGLGLAAIAMPGPDVGKGAKFADEAAEGITAYHGSPHTFDKFSMDKIGTGEGAQAYGHGLYFAENEKVAQGYRDTLSYMAPKPSDTAHVHAARSFIESGYDDASTIAGMKKAYPTATEADIRAAIGEVKGHDKGATYQVRLNVKPDELLDWDRPLGGHAKKAKDNLFKALTDRGIDKSVANYLVNSDKPGHVAIAAAARGKYDTRLNVPDGEMSAQASAALKAAGIKGIRYKDAGSRDSAGGTYNYVIFDDSLVSILKRYAIPFTLGAGGAAMVSGQDMPDEIAAQMGPEA